MMFKFFSKTYTLLALLTFVHVGGLKAQNHAEVTSQQWKGIDVSTVIGNSAYPDDNSLEHGYPFLLYNVGTGRFVIQGGDWAMEGRLFFSDFGRQMYLYSNGRINAGITESTAATKNSFCVRPPEPFGKTWSDQNYRTINLTTLMDGSNQSKYKMNWTFERVEDASNTDTYTYYMYQVWTGRTPNVKYYLGAAWGECHNTSIGKGDGQFVYWDDDRSCWTTGNVKGNTDTLPLENGDEIEIQKLYQWRIISIDEFVDVLTQNSVGLNPSISSLIKDRDFTRNANDFFGENDWAVSTLSDYTYNSPKRYTYTWGDYRTGQSPVSKNNQQSMNPRYVNEPWDTPVRLKECFDKVTSTSTDDQASGKKNAKFGFMSFEGVGTVSTNFEAPKHGWYQIECVGFTMSENNHDAYLFARVIPNSRVNDPENTFEIPSAAEPHYGEVTLEQLPFETYTKESYETCLEAGKELLYNADDHKQKVWVLVSQEDYDNGNRTIRLGFRKEEATRSELVGSGNNSGYYDTDWVCVDDIRASYMGLSPVFFYDDEEDLSYLSHAEADRQRFLANQYTPAEWDGRYAGAACLQRNFSKTMKEGEDEESYDWNTFSFPIPLTGEQVRNAFGEESELLRLHSIGLLSNNDCIIDFQTVNLLTLSNVVEPGYLYMLKPSKDPAFGETPRGQMAYYYDLGKLFFSTNSEDENNSEYQYPYMNLNTWSGQQDVGSYEDKNDGTGFVTFIRTPNYSTFKVNKDGIKHASVESPEGSYAPKGSYAMSKGKMYELSRDTPIKGFRGWITLTHSIFDNPESQNDGARIAINGVVDGDDTNNIDLQSIIPMNPNAITAVYDLSGRKVSISVANLPKGMYIVGGKKLLVK
ncbi:MAG: T9SS type A sorting domain-containing protein [Prevotella sp.]|nr:T9SS type A sorting domain-containing protein [Prevotella sp.]